MVRAGSCMAKRPLAGLACARIDPRTWLLFEHGGGRRRSESFNSQLFFRKAPGNKLAFKTRQAGFQQLAIAFNIAAMCLKPGKIHLIQLGTPKNFSKLKVQNLEYPWKPSLSIALATSMNRATCLIRR